MAEIKYCLSCQNLWQSGEYTGMEQQPDGSLLFCDSLRPGIFITRVFRGQAPDMLWNTCRFGIEGDCVFSIYAVFFPGEASVRSFEQLKTVEDRAAYCREKAAVISNYPEFLLYNKDQIKGLFMAACLYVYPVRNNARVIIRDYKISYPRLNFIKYLPGVYRPNRELELFMAVLQTPYLELEEEIEQMPDVLHLTHADKEAVHQAGQMLGMDTVRMEEEYSIPIEHIKRLAKQWISLNQIKGKKQYYKQVIEIVTGGVIDIVECEDWISRKLGKNEKRRLFELFGKEEFCFFVFYQGEEKFLRWIRYFLDMEKPVFSEYSLFLLKEAQGLLGHCYLGINSYL